MELESVDLNLLAEIHSKSATPTISLNEQSTSALLRQLKYPHPPKEGTIAKIVSSLWYIPSSAPVLEVVDELSGKESIEAVGVVDSSNKLLGILIRENLFQMIGRPFGRDLLGRQALESIISQVKRFAWNENIFTIAELVEQRERNIRYYLLTNENQEFMGIFSSWDMMMFLSNLTRQDLGLARTIQSRLIHDLSNRKEDRFELTYSTQMAKGIGGDFIGTKSITADHHLFVLCDVAGKGIAAALIASTIAGMLESYDFSKGIKGFLTLLNRFIRNTFGSEIFVTGVFIEYNAKSSLLTVYDLGHAHISLFRKNRISPLKSPVTNPPFGIEEELRPRGYQFLLEPGNILLVYSDGLIEQEDSTGTTYSLMRIQSLLHTYSSVPLSSLLIRIWEDFHTFRKDIPQSDDVTLLLLRPH
jgi:sigma-B regulation protein RsbU (phosphoserine phosphatase)